MEIFVSRNGTVALGDGYVVGQFADLGTAADAAVRHAQDNDADRYAIYYM